MIDLELLGLLLVDSSQGEYTAITQNIVDYVRPRTDAWVEVDEEYPQKFNVRIGRGEPRVLVNVHMDTVAVVDGWDYDPFTPTVVGDRIYGLGTTDTKGNLYAALTAFLQTRPRDVMLLFSFDEEDGSDRSGVVSFLKGPQAQGITHALVCEPTRLDLVHRHKGYFSFEIDTFAQPGHSSSGDMTQNAIVKAGAVVQDLARAGFNVGRIQGGKAGNIVAETCTMRISIRSYDRADELRDRLETVLSSTLNPGDYRVRTRFEGPAFDNPRPQAFPGLGTRTFHEVSFWTEAALFQQAGIDALVFGAGSIQQAHKNNEFVHIDQLEGAVAFFMEFFGQFQ